MRILFVCFGWYGYVVLFGVCLWDGIGDGIGRYLHFLLALWALGVLRITLFGAVSRLRVWDCRGCYLGCCCWFICLIRCVVYPIILLRGLAGVCRWLDHIRGSEGGRPCVEGVMAWHRYLLPMVFTLLGLYIHTERYIPIEDFGIS